MTTPSFTAVARALGHDDFTLRGDGTILLDGAPGEMPTVHAPLTEGEIADAEAAIDADAAAIVPERVSARQARLALIGAGLIGTVEAAIGGLSAYDQAEWEYAAEIRRDHPLIASLGVALSLSEGDIDELFRIAGNIV